MILLVVEVVQDIVAVSLSVKYSGWHPYLVSICPCIRIHVRSGLLSVGWVGAATWMACYLPAPAASLVVYFVHVLHVG